MRKILLYTRLAGLLILLSICTLSATAQKKQRGRQQPPTEISAVVTDEDGKPLKNVAILCGEYANVVFTDASGRFTAKAALGSTIIIEAQGYEDKSFRITGENSIPAQVELKKEPLFVTEESLLNRADGGKTYQAHLVGATSVLRNEQLGTYPELNLTNTLQGKLLGLQIQSTVSGLGNNVSDVYIRGLHGYSGNTAIIVIDGVERPFEDLMAEEIENIEVLKDATAKILYGARAANGVLLVKTRRGKENRRTFNVGVEAGIMQMTRTPDYLNSYDYATLYNEARANDGLPAFYSQTQLDGYKNSTSSFDQLYPNVDHYNQFLSKNANYRKVSFDMTGGNDRVRYALIAGYTGGSGFEDVSEKPQLNRLNIRGNLDFKVTDFLSISTDVAARMEMREWGQLDCGQVFSALSSHRPNEYPLTINSELSGLTSGEENIPVFGASKLRPMNLYAETMYGGYTEERYTSNQTNIGLNFDLNTITKGLTAGAFLTFDNYDYLRLSLSKVYPTYAINSYINADGEEETRYTQMKKQEIQTTQQRNSTTLKQRLGWNAHVAYDLSLDKHDLGARFTYMFTKETNQGVTQDIINSNYVLRLNYLYDKKYALEGNVGYMGSNRFDDGNKYFLSTAAGLAWIISNEEFLKYNDNINFLKLKTSAGMLGYDRGTTHLLHKQEWNQDGSFRFGKTNGGYTAWLTSLIRVSNPDLKWEKTAEWNVGMEGLFLKNRLSAEVNYFREKRMNIIGTLSESYTNVLGDFYYHDNMGTVLNQGFEGQFSWSDRVGNLAYTVGTNFIWTKNKILKWNEVNHDEEYRYEVGKSTDAMMGLVYQGLFGKDVAISGYPNQTFGSYQEGDMAYNDLNNDGIIDGRDVEQLGNSYPRTTLGLDINLQYKGWGLYIQGYAEMGVNAWATNSYYQNYGENKYSTVALDRYHPENNPTGSYPRLTTTNGLNNFQQSSYWLKKTDFFRLKNFELSYTFSNISTKTSLDKIKIFTRGANLFVLSSVKDLDPELLNAGVTNYPVYRTLTAGISFAF